jgi:hypothetical protein
MAGLVMSTWLPQSPMKSIHWGGGEGALCASVKRVDNRNSKK